MGQIDVFLQQFDDAWSHSFESVTAALDGVTDDEAAWQAPCYRDEKHEDGWPAPGTIRWQVCHLAHCKRHYTDFLLQAGQSDRPQVRPWQPLPTFRAERDALVAAHETQRRAIVELGDDRLDLIAGNDMPFREFLAMFTRHDIWHAAQIALVRRLYRMASPACRGGE